jgi:serine/threonine-protein kinase
MGRVFLAHQHSLDRDVAVKTVRDQASAEEREALLSEGAISGHLEHPAIIPVHALGVDAEGRPVLVMKRALGVAWDDLVDDPRHPAWQGRGGDEDDRLDAHLEILMAACNAVHFAHSHGVLHRDIKPQNVLLGRYGEVYLGDWGLALRTKNAGEPQPLCGTPAFMAPEMALGEPVDARTDVYLLGATLHRVLTGLDRHAGRGLNDTLAAAARSAPYAYPPSVPEALASLANRATSRDPGARPATAEAFRREISSFLRNKSSLALERQAKARLAKLRALLADGAALGSEDRQREIDLIAVEARFALQQAIEAWGGNPSAAKAMEELEGLLASRRARAAELERMARELDPQVARRQRTMVSGALALVGVILAVWGVAGHWQRATPERLLVQSLAPLAIVSLSVALLRRHLLGTALNRRATAAALVVLGSVTVHRLLGLVDGSTPAQIVKSDALLIGAISAVCAAFLFRWLAVPALLMLGTAALGVAFPEHAVLAFALVTGVCVVTIALKSASGEV